MSPFLITYFIWVTSAFLASFIIHIIDKEELKDIILSNICEPDDRSWWCFTKKAIYRFLTWPVYLPFYFSRFRFLFKQKDS